MPPRGGIDVLVTACLRTGIDINPFHNPYVKGDLVLPELASAYLDRENVTPGMIIEGDVVTSAFAEIGWGWGVVIGNR